MKMLMIGLVAGVMMCCTHSQDTGTKSAKTSSPGEQFSDNQIEMGITDTMPPKIPVSKTPYYPTRKVPSEVDGYLLAGGRFDEYDMTNVVEHFVQNPDKNNMNKVLVKVDFFDMDNKLRGSYNVKANNPYTSEKYKPFLSESYMDVSRSIIDRRAHLDYDWRKHVKQYATWVSLEVNTACESVALGYFLQALDEAGTLLGIVATFILLDNCGKEIARFEDIKDVFLGEGMVTCDQKYFFLRYGGEFTENAESMYNEHLRIYDIKEKKIIYEWELPEGDQFQSTPQEKKGGWGWIVKSSSAKKIPTFVAFNLANRLIYTSPEDTRLPYIRSFTKDGFIIQNQKTKAFERIWYKDWPSIVF